MKNNLLADKFKNLGQQFTSSINNISRDNNQVDFNKEEEIINRLQHKLGRSKEEVKNMVSKNLLNILSMVPFSMENDVE